jgi:hypothetical protein
MWVGLRDWVRDSGLRIRVGSGLKELFSKEIGLVIFWARKGNEDVK